MRHTAVAVAASVLVALAVAGCSTNQATGVDSTGATLNADGGCSKGRSGSWQYQLADVTAGTGWRNVGPVTEYNCPWDTGVGAIQPHRVERLVPGHVHQFRIKANWRLADGRTGTSYFDSDGTLDNGAQYDTFTTPEVAAADVSPPERALAFDSATGCRVKEITNRRNGNSWPLGTRLWTITLVTSWKYCPNGQIVRMDPAGADCTVTSAGALVGWKCGAVSKIRAYSQGGDPEHAVYTYSYNLIQTPWFSDGVTLVTKRWCATNQISGTGAHRRHGSCDIKPW